MRQFRSEQAGFRFSDIDGHVCRIPNSFTVICNNIPATDVQQDCFFASLGVVNRLSGDDGFE